MCEEYLEGDLQNDEGHGEEGRPANHTVDQICEDSQVDRTDPQVVHEYEGQVETLHVVGGEVDHMTCRHLAQCHLTQFQYLQCVSVSIQGMNNAFITSADFSPANLLVDGVSAHHTNHHACLLAEDEGMGMQHCHCQCHQN